MGRPDFDSRRERNTDAFCLKAFGDVLEQPILGHKFVRVVFNPSVEAEDLGVVTEFVEKNTGLRRFENVRALTQELEHGVLDVGNVLIVFHANVKHEGDTSTLPVAAASSVVDDGRVHEVVVGNHHEVFADREHLGRENTNRNDRPEVTVHLDAVTDLKGLVESEHERVDDVTERLLHRQTDDEGKDRQRGQKPEEFEPEFAQGKVKTAEPYRGSQQEDDEGIAARNGDRGRV